MDKYKIGTKTGKLTVNEVKYVNGIRHYNCSCTCGNNVLISYKAISGKKGTKSCGCLTQEVKLDKLKIRLINLRVGRLTIKEYAGSDGKNRLWKCQCDCGNNTLLPTNKLTSGWTKSCGCLWKESVTKHGKWGTKEYITFLRNNDPMRRLKSYISSRIRETLKSKKIIKNGMATFKHLSYTPQQLKEHLENQFEPWMNWNNYGGKLGDGKEGWWIDHIIPHSSFNYTSLKDKAFRDCWALENLRPLEKYANAQKHCKMI